MRPEEAQWVRDQLIRLSPERISPLIELGSATLAYRTSDSPHIDRFVHGPLKERGVKVLHTDMKGGDGIDISGDIYNPTVQAQLRAVKANCILCCNILEHVVEQSSFARACDAILQPGGVAIVTVPRSYPVHLDPIDTYFRPAPSEIAALFPTYTILANQIIVSQTYLDEIRQVSHPLYFMLKSWAKILLLRGGVGATRCRARRWLWLFRPYKVSAVVLSKPGLSPPRQMFSPGVEPDAVLNEIIP